MRIFFFVAIILQSLISFLFNFYSAYADLTVICLLRFSYLRLIFVTLWLENLSFLVFIGYYLS